MKNKNRLIRKSVFETNSSSSHSLAIVGDIVYDTLEVGKDGSITIEVGGYDFGRQIPRVTNNTIEKIAFLVTLYNRFKGVNYLKEMQLLTDVIKENLSKMGNIRLVECNYSQLSSRYEAFKKGIIAPVFDKKQGGGVLGDLNIYNIHFVVGLFGAPKNSEYYPNIVREVDTSGILILEYDEFKVVCIAAKDTYNNSYANIQGDKGLIKVIGPLNEVPNYIIKNKEVEMKVNKNIHKHRMYSEFKKFIDVIDNKDFDFMQKQKAHSLAVMEIFDKSRKQIN